MMRIVRHPAPALAVAGAGDTSAATQPVNLTVTYNASTNTLTYSANNGDVTIHHGNSGVITIQLGNQSTSGWVFDSISITGENNAPTSVFTTTVNPRTIVINDDNTGSHTQAYTYDYCITMKNTSSGEKKTVDPKIVNEP